MDVVAEDKPKERQNRKILEQLEEEKKRLRMQQAKTVSLSATTNSMSSSFPASTSAVTSSQTMISQESQHMTPAQRAALQHAHANSVGYFITQESAFGNLILPVLPRFDK